MAQVGVRLGYQRYKNGPMRGRDGHGLHRVFVSFSLFFLLFALQIRQGETIVDVWSYRGSDPDGTELQVYQCTVAREIMTVMQSLCKYPACDGRVVEAAVSVAV
jgi:hypothetical protein